ncbi:MAG: polysaccharide biosynthesis protein [Mangrovibacterium sp.]
MSTAIRNIFKKHSLPRKLVLLSDLILVALSFLAASILRYNLNISLISLKEVLIQLLFILPVYLLSFLVFGSYRGILRHSSIEDFFKLFLAVLTGGIIAMAAACLTHVVLITGECVIPYSVTLIHGVICFMALIGFRLVIRSVYQAYMNPREGQRSALIFGAGQMGQLALSVLESDTLSKIRVVGFIDDKKSLEGKQLAGKQIYSEDQAFDKIINTKKVTEVLLAVKRDRISANRKKKLFDRCLEAGITVRQVPPVKEWIGGKFSARQIQEINIEDLLGRDPIWLNLDTVAAGLIDKTILVTGAAGSIGAEIVRQLMDFACKKVIMLDQAESALYDLQNELLKSQDNARFKVVVASVSDPVRMRWVFEEFRPQYVFNAAAYKHVPLMEASPYEAVRVNIGGTKLLADLAMKYGVKKFVMISTDKAVNPTNVMGASKRICEIYIQSIAQSGKTDTQFITTRFGNVLGSNGSVVPLFRRQIAAGGPVTVTHPDIIRYFMTIPEACQLVLEAGFMGHGGEIYVFDMGDPVKIYDLAVKMISLAGLKPEEDIPIVFTGLRPGEKLYEELLADEENTIYTHHPKIKTALVRPHNFELVKPAIEELLKASQSENSGQLVSRMKKLVPEFISKNSEYCEMDMTMTAVPD